MIERELRCSSALTPAGWVSPAVIRLDTAGNIQAVEHVAAPASKTGNAPYGHIVPGMPNLHSHAFQRQMAGLSGMPSADRNDSFWSWRELMYRLALRITPEQLQAITAFLQAEMLEKGYTSCAEFHYLHHQANGNAYADPAEMSARILQAAGDSGMALTLLPVLYCRSGFNSDEVSTRQLRFRNSVETYLDLLQACRKHMGNSSLHHLGLAPHSLRAVSDQNLTELFAGIDSDNLPIHIHIAEQRREVDECLETLGVRPVQWLLDQQPVGENWCLVHATHMDEAEIAKVHESEAVVGLCPSTEADLGDGYFPVEHWFQNGGRLGIGSDSNLRLSPAEELRMLEFQARLHSGRRNVLAEAGFSCGRSLFQRALAGGAQATGQAVGGLAPGLRADLVELDDQHPLLAGRTGDVILDSWILAGEGDLVRSVWVGGQKQVENGRHVRREQLRPAFVKAMKELL